MLSRDQVARGEWNAAPETNTVMARLNSFGEVAAMAFDGTNIWAGDLSMRLTKIDARSNTILDTIQLDTYPYAIAFDGRLLWVGGSHLTAVDPTNDDIVMTLPIESDDVIFAAGLIWTVDANGTVSRVDPVSWEEVLPRFNVGGRPIRLGFDGAAIWVSRWETTDLVQLDPATGAVIATIDLPITYFDGDGDGDDPDYLVLYHALDFAYDGTRLWVALVPEEAGPFSFLGGPGRLLAIDPADATVEQDVVLGQAPHSLLFDGRHLWVPDRTDMAGSMIGPISPVYEFDVETTTVIDKVDVLVGAQAVTFDGTNLWVGGSAATKIQIDPS